MAASSKIVFINCPFDETYRECFEAIVFTCTACGFAPRATLSSSGQTILRFSTIRNVIQSAAVGVHDLSRTESDVQGRPRFNMPFELGFFIGAKEFGGKSQRSKHTLVMVRDKHTLGAYLSDLAGIDPFAHADDPRKIIKIVRDSLNAFSLARTRKGIGKKLLPGPRQITIAFNRFRMDLPRIARDAGFDPSTVNVIDAHHDYLEFVRQYLSVTGVSNIKGRKHS